MLLDGPLLPGPLPLFPGTTDPLQLSLTLPWAPIVVVPSAKEPPSPVTP